MTISAIRSAMARPWIRRLLTLLFLSTIAALILRQSRAVDWSEVGHTLRSYESSIIAIAGGLAALSYLIYSCFDLLGRHYLGIKMAATQVMRTAFVSYAFNQSLGSLVGGVAFRFRLYARLGLNSEQISQIILVSVLTNWLGYSVLAGSMFASGLLSIPQWSGGRMFLQAVGALLLLMGGAYLGLCTLYGRRVIKVRKRRFHVPSLNLALVQLLLSALHWPVAAAILFLLFNGAIDFAMVLGALLLSAIAAAIAHIPAGIGVLEGIFIALFGHRVPIDTLLGALLAFRAVYHIAPLTFAAFTYLGLELFSSRSQGNAVAQPQNSTRQWLT